MIDRTVDVQLTDGGWIRVRPIEPTDADGIVDLHARMSERTRYFRFFGAYPRIPAADLKRFVTVDHHDREALVAVLGNGLIAVARYERLSHTAADAELAFVVADAHQRRGIAAILLERLVLAGREEGITRFVADVLPTNTPMLRLFAAAGFQIEHRYAEGVVHVTLPIIP